MKKTMEKTLVILFIAMLIASSTLILQAYAANIPTAASLNAEPNPVQVGTPLYITGSITPPPPGEAIFHGLTLTIIMPEGSDSIGSLTTDSDGNLGLYYTPDQLGWYSFQLTYPGEDIGEDHYSGSESLPLLVYVQYEPIPPEYVLEITVNPPEGGTVTKYPDLETYPLGTEVELTATANEGYTFVGWSGDLSGTDSPQTLIIDEDPQVTATFALDYIPESTDPVTVYPHPDVVLTFDEVLTGGEVYVTTSYEGPPGYPLGGYGPYYYIEANPLTFTTVSIGIHYDETELTKPETELTLWRFDPAVPVDGDVNGNGRVDFTDLLRIAFSLGSRPGRWRWNPACDLNGDLKVNFIDLWIAFMNFGKSSTPAGWTDITAYVDAENNIVYGETDHFSPYRVH